MKKICAFMFIACLFATTAFAYDHLITNDTAKVIDQGAIQAEAAVGYFTASKAYDADGDTYDITDNLGNKEDGTQLTIPVKVRWGCKLVPNLELSAILPFEKWDVGDAGESGIGDLWIAGKYGLMPEGLLTLRGALDIPLGDEEKGLGQDGGFGIDVAAMTQKQLSMIKVDGQVGLRYNAEDSDTKWQPGLGIYLDGEGSYELSKVLAVQAGLELMFVGDGKDDGEDSKDSGENWIELNVGAKYALNEKMCLKGDILYNLAGKNTPQYFGILVRLAYGL